MRTVEKVISESDLGKTKLFRVKTTLPPQIYAQVPRIKAKLEERGYSRKGKPTHNPKQLNSRDDQIIKLYEGIARGLLNYYKCTSNFVQVQTIVDYHLRYSCLATLSGKHKSSLRKTVEKYGKEFQCEIYNKKGELMTKRDFPTTEVFRKRI
uniref:Putative group II intron maturase n=1 Tax=Coleochaete scutata TaxID=3125 RepID=A0A5P9NW25_COLSC|nr:putative group II intron maturase [Coleochaete scutata]QFU80151.1 putative group II intron maturase [Coleochaete scutata]